ncbi:MAG: sensor histidine kinase [Nocardiopsaceae bacterium]|nr:sensor histidine kinase [Nocardiopsaceae bacterium]
MHRLPGRPTPFDITITAVAALCVFASSVFLDLSAAPGEVRPLLPWGHILLLAAVVPLLWRTRYPVPVGVVSTTTATVYYPLAFPDGLVMLAGAVALYTMVEQGYRWQGWLLGFAQFLVLHVWEAIAYGSPRLGPAFGVLAWMLVILIFAEVMRKRREYLDAVHANTEEAARTREEAFRRRVADERVQLAREVHDTVAHNISLINVQAGTALYLIDSEPERAAEALATIKHTSKETLQELRATLNVLRSVDEKAPRSPTPDLDRLADLIEGARGTGLDIRLDVRGDRRRLPTNVEAAAYRIVQESLTNTVRHADATAVDVDVCYTSGWLELHVQDNGAALVSGFTAGNGITGMRERAQALGGELEVGARPEGGFAVRARLPGIDTDDRPADGALPRPAQQGKQEL